MKFEQIKKKVDEHDKILERIKNCTNIISRCSKKYEFEWSYGYGMSFENWFGQEIFDNIRKDLKIIMQKELVILQAKANKLQQEIANL